MTSNVFDLMPRIWDTAFNARLRQINTALTERGYVLGAIDDTSEKRIHYYARLAKPETPTVFVHTDGAQKDKVAIIPRHNPDIEVQPPTRFVSTTDFLKDVDNALNPRPEATAAGPTPPGLKGLAQRFRNLIRPGG